MKEWIYATDGWKWNFYKITKGKYKDKIVLKTTDDIIYIEILPKVFKSYKIYDNEKDIYQYLDLDINSSEYKDLISKFFCPLEDCFDKDKLQKITIDILKVEPELIYQTLLGWLSNKPEDNPNEFSGQYIYPDGNTYTITFQKGLLKLYPGSEKCLSLPYVSCEFPMTEWIKLI